MTPTLKLVELLCAKRAGVEQPWWMPVTVALWFPPGRIPRGMDGLTATVTMSAGLYVRLYPWGHYGP